MIGNRNKGLAILCALAIVQGLLRFAIPASALAGSGPELETPVSDMTLLFIHSMFVLIGAVGVASAYGLWNGRRWGWSGTIGISVVTIAFDVWAIAFVQASAALGLVLPAAFIIYLLRTRSRSALEVWDREGSRGIRD